jgi:hypothetical protein
MVSDYVMNRSNCVGTAVAPDSVGLAAYTMDLAQHPALRRKWFVKNEGDVQIRLRHLIQWHIGQLSPKSASVKTCSCPWCLSVISHCGSIRMEPVRLRFYPNQPPQQLALRWMTK